MGLTLLATFEDKALGGSRMADMIAPLVLAIAFVLFGAILSLNAFFSRVRFTTDEIEVRTLFSRRSIRLCDIGGRRQYFVRGNKGRKFLRYCLVSDRTGQKRLEIPDAFRLDQDFFNWFYSLCDFDTEQSASQ
jgi:hypothetical protein